MAKAKYNRILLKLSGEALMGQDAFGVNPEIVTKIVKEIKVAKELGIEVAVVIGGGNIFRGVALGAAGMDRATADYMGMLATVMNALALQDAMKHEGVVSRVQSAINIDQVVEPYIRGKAIKYLEDKRIVIFAAGTGNPFFTTDSAASLRAIEIGAELLIKATKVDGVYSSDPVKNNDAIRYDTLNYDEVIERKLSVMDTTAVVLCRDNKMPLRILDMRKPGVLLKVAKGDDEGTLVSNN